MATKKKEFTPLEALCKKLKLNKNQVAAVEEYEKIYGNALKMCEGKTAYQIGCNLISKDLIRLFFTEV